MSGATDRLELEWVEEPAADLLRVLFDYQAAVERRRAALARRAGHRTGADGSPRASACRGSTRGLTKTAVRRAVAAVTRIAAVDLMEANENAHTALSYGVTAPHTENGRRQDRTVRFFDFDDPSANVFEFARQVSIKGPRQDIIPDIDRLCEWAPAGCHRMQIARAGRSNGRGHSPVPTL